MLRLKQKRSRHRRGEILAAAITVGASKGLHATTLTEIASEAGVPLPSIYDYFENKTRLFAALPATIFEGFHQDIHREIEAADTAIEKLRIHFNSTLHYMEQRPEWARVFFLDIWPGSLAREPEVRAAVDDFGSQVVDLVRLGIRRSEFSPGTDPHLVMSMLMGSLSHLVAVWLLYDAPYRLVQRGEEAFDLIARGLELRSS